MEGSSDGTEPDKSQATIGTGTAHTGTVSTKWKLIIKVKSRLVDKILKGEIKITIAEEEDRKGSTRTRGGTTEFYDRKIEKKDESIAELIYSGKTKDSFYLYGRGVDDPWLESWEDVKVDKADLKKGQTLTKEIIIEPSTFSKILFFSGSLSYQEKIMNSKGEEVVVDDGNENNKILHDYLMKTWDYKDYVWTIQERLTDRFKDPNWKYLLCQQVPPIYEAGKKEFKLYNNNLVPEKKSRKDLDSWLTTNGEKVGSFACTASVSGNNDKRPEYLEVIYDGKEKKYGYWKKFSEKNGWELFNNDKWERWKIPAKWKLNEKMIDHFINNECAECKKLDLLKELQKWHDLDETGNLDPKTMKILFPTQPLGTDFPFWKWEDGSGWYYRNKESEDWTLWKLKPSDEKIKSEIREHIRDGCTQCKKKNRLKEFQKNHNLTQTGIYDPATIKKLYPEGPTKKPLKTKVVSNQSSRIPDKQLSDFVNNLTKKGIGAPVFSVCDCNSFHTSGYLWGMYAKMMTDKNKKLKDLPFVVLNFDAHEDYSEAGYPSSDGWGGQLIRDLEKKECCYTKVGSNAGYRCYNKEDGKEEKNVDYGKLWEAVKKWFYPKKSIDQVAVRVFISVDRDCLEKHQTQWLAHPPYKTIDDLTSTKYAKEGAMTILLEGLSENDYLVGCDVTGLPEHNKMAHKDGKAGSVDSAWEDVNKQIEEIYELVRKKLNKTAKILK